MQRLFALFLAMVFTVMVSAQTTAHVLEPIATISATNAAFLGHSAGDADEVAADGDMDVPHHHAACHDHAVGLPVAAAGMTRALPAVPEPCARGYAARATAGPGALLRPPRT